MNNIIFTDSTGTISNEFYPVSASSNIPDWYKNLNSYIGNEKKPDGAGGTTATIKRCMPVFDAMSSGYIIPTYVDIWISQKEEVLSNGTIIKLPWYERPAHDPIFFHSIEQAPTYPGKNNMNAPYPKWINPWSISTPNGYSTLFIQPLHRDSPFTILPGVVDTDRYSSPVHFPFVLNDWSFEGLIPAGTPMVQIIPIKRDNWKMSIGEKKDFIKQEKDLAKLKSRFFDSYKTGFRQNKSYK